MYVLVRNISPFSCKKWEEFPCHQTITLGLTFITMIINIFHFKIPGNSVTGGPEPAPVWWIKWWVQFFAKELSKSYWLGGGVGSNLSFQDKAKHITGHYPAKENSECGKAISRGRVPWEYYIQKLDTIFGGRIFGTMAWRSIMWCFFWCGKGADCSSDIWPIFQVFKCTDWIVAILTYSVLHWNNEKHEVL